MMQKSMMGKWIALLLAAMILLAACGPAQTSSAQPVSSAAAQSGAEIEKGEGQTAFTLQVVGADGQQTDFAIHTDEKTVGAALLKLELVAGENSQYGLYVKTVNGVTADDKAKQYWAFYVDGKYAEKGVDATEIVAGATYALKLESYS